MASTIVPCRQVVFIGWRDDLAQVAICQGLLLELEKLGMTAIKKDAAEAGVPAVLSCTLGIQRGMSVIPEVLENLLQSSAVLFAAKVIWAKKTPKQLQSSTRLCCVTVNSPPTPRRHRRHQPRERYKCPRPSSKRVNLRPALGNSP